MKNEDIRKAILRISHIKSLQEEANILRKQVINELKRRKRYKGKDGSIKINLSGPKKDDYVVLKEIQATEYDPVDFYRLLLDIANDSSDDNEQAARIALSNLLQCVKVVKKKVSESLSNDYLIEVEECVRLKSSYTQEQLTYKISTDDMNMVRGIDL
jgi:hypothetical protein